MLTFAHQSMTRRGLATEGAVPNHRRSKVERSEPSKVIGLYRDNGKENGNYRDYRGLYWGYIGII